ncbi:carbohydrate sulfotransferase 11 isoform X1 [Glossina fuscipes]|uniref:Carbohydrate sulfotransferase n=2 Tax=Glossina fuscipes TaxID=7396 RepID=A0A8U0WBY2_9MUSC|nr:carbohydrate sulfotransferase 11 isoform X1 [Glossina fuscipes]
MLLTRTVGQQNSFLSITMHIRMYMWYDRHIQGSIKLIIFLLVAVFYVTFLCRESQTAYELNKVKAESSGVVHLQPQTGSKFLNLIQSKLKPPIPKLDSVELPGINNVITTFNPVYEYSEEIHAAIEKELKQRNLHLREVCERYQLQFVYPPNPREFFISHGHSLIWCNVFKAASSTWLYYFNILGGYNVKFLQQIVYQPLELARKRFPRPELPELLESLPYLLSFLFVRDPFERIVSGYRNKLEDCKNSYYKSLAKRIIKRFRKHPIAGRTKKCPTFQEFVQYLIEQHKQGKPFDEHWAPIYSFCTPCSIEFNIIGKLETFARDSEFIIREAGLEYLLLDKLPKNKLSRIGNLAKGGKTNILMKIYLSEINRTTFDQLLNIYRWDFELFDYDFKKYYDYIIPDVVEDAKNATLKPTMDVKNYTATKM